MLAMREMQGAGVRGPEYLPGFDGYSDCVPGVEADTLGFRPGTRSLGCFQTEQLLFGTAAAA